MMRLDTVRTQPFASAAAHIEAEFQWLDARIADYLRRLEDEKRFDDSTLRGLKLDTDHVIAGLTPTDIPTRSEDPLREIIDARASFAPTPPLYQIAATFGLDPFERTALMVAAAPALDSRYRSALAMAQNDVTRHWASPNLIIDMLAPDARFDALGAFADDAPLLRHRLLVPLAPGVQTGLADRALGVDARVAMALLGQVAGVPAALSYALTPLDPEAEDWAPDLLTMPIGAKPVTVFETRRDSGQQALAARRAMQHGQGLLRLDLSRLPANAEAENLIILAAREAMLRGAFLYIVADDLARDAPAISGVTQLLSHGVPFALSAGTDLAHRITTAAPTRVERIALKPLEATDRLVWLRRTDGGLNEAVLTRIAWGTRLGPAGIARLNWGAEAHDRAPLPSLLRPVQARWTRDDLVLSETLARQLDELTAFVTNWPTVLGDWDFVHSNPQARHCLALFSGPSGTGKTMAASVVARAAQVPLYRASLASIFDKYLGETEKQIDRLFEAAAEAGVAILCDEADALFGARTEQNDAHARYANLTVSHLLQRIEEHEGLVILTSNLPRNMDDAFARRIGHALAFTLPDATGRRKLWQRAFPAQAPLADTVDLSAIAETFELSGGDIRNAALAAAYLAAAMGTPIGMPHLLRAIERELSKAGRTPIAADFGRLDAAR